MITKLAYLLLFIIFSFFSYAQTSNYGLPVEDPEVILKNQDNFLKYYNTYLKLSENFIGLDSSSQVIERGVFLQYISSGKFLPLRLISKDPVYFKLYKINTSVDNMITVLLQSIGITEYKYFQLEGKPLPFFNYVDLNDNVYNIENTKGKIVVLKFWFIHCTTCVAEFPALNKLVNNYAKRKDILFLSLAFDQKSDLVNFLKKNKLNYAVIANQKKYVLEDLGIALFPTHLVINKNGDVVKVVNSYEELEPILRKEALN